jgi:hypothetical protein
MNGYMSFSAVKFISNCDPTVAKMIKIEFDRAVGNDAEYNQM